MHASPELQDFDGEEDIDTGPASGWEILKDPKGGLVVGSQIGVKVCQLTCSCVYY